MTSTMSSRAATTATTTIGAPAITTVGEIDGRPVRPSLRYRIAQPDDPAIDDLVEQLDPRPGEQLLLPVDMSAAGIKLVDRATAELLTGRASRTPEQADLAALVLDGILTMDGPSGAVTGPLATALLSHTPDDSAPTPATQLGSISRSALERASKLAAESPAAIAAWLYACNTVPMSPRWTGLAKHVERRLAEIQRSGALSGYEPSTTDAWAQWQRPDADTTRLTRKLYVSVHPTDLVGSLQPAIGAIVEAGARAFKVTRGVYGPLRPDKLVAYFDRHDPMLSAAHGLSRALDGVTAQGVPFTAELGADALVSWGVDPPRDARLSGWNRTDSWRSWMTNRLGRLIADGCAAGCSTTETLEYVEMRIGLDGVDARNWTPSDDLWDGVGGRP